MGNSIGIGVGVGVRLGSKTNPNQIPTADLVQRLFKADQPVSQSLGTKAIDYSLGAVNADILETYLNALPTGTSFFHPFSSSKTGDPVSIPIDWSTDGAKIEVVACINPGKNDYFCASMVGDVNSGFFIRSTSIRIYGLLADRTTYSYKYWPTTNPTDGSFIRVRVSVVGSNILFQKTTPADVNFTNATSALVAKDPAWTTDAFYQFRTGVGGIVYANIAGRKFVFGAANGDGHFVYSYTHEIRVWVNNLLNLSLTQSVYCHNAIYGYTHAFVRHGDDQFLEYINFPNDENGESTVELHEGGVTASALLLLDIIKHYNSNDSFGYGYAIKLNASLLAYDVDNTFFDSGGIGKKLFRPNIPSKLGSKIFFDHVNSNELLIYSQAKTLLRPINTAGATVVGIGSSSMNPTYFWQSAIEHLSGMNPGTYLSYSGFKLVNFLPELQNQLIATPTLLANADIIYLQGGYNDWAGNESVTSFREGAAELFSFIRQNAPNATIVVLGSWNTGIPMQDGTVPNSAGLTLNQLREEMLALTVPDAKSKYVNLVEAGLVQSELDATSGVHLAKKSGQFKVAKIIYDKILEIIN